MKDFVKYIIKDGGSIKPLIIDSSLTNGTGLFNPSILVDKDQLLINVRHCQYTLYHSELNIHEHPYGPLLYFNPENDITLTTTNYLGKLDDELNLKEYSKVDTSKLDEKPLWEFIGLEDARLVRWDDTLYLIGVRRDTTTDGQGRMELSEIEMKGNQISEVSRFRIPAPGKDDSYCEKNWMPILDKPFHFLKWSNPVEVVRVDPKKKSCETVFLSDTRHFDRDQRGGGQVIPFNDGYLTLTHETYLYKSEVGKKNATYLHRLIHWTKDFEPIKVSRSFSFMGAKIEFACGLAEYKGDILITFGFQDNAAFVLKCKKDSIRNFIYD
jgi:hypothetical protein